MAVTSSEGSDRTDLTLPDWQNALVSAVTAVQKNTIVVARCPGACMMTWVDQASTILYQLMPGQEAGSALANTIFGDNVPGGKLPVSFPNNMSDTCECTRARPRERCRLRMPRAASAALRYRLSRGLQGWAIPSTPSNTPAPTAAWAGSRRTTPCVCARHGSDASDCRYPVSCLRRAGYVHLCPLPVSLSPRAAVQENLLFGYRWYDSQNIEPLWPFGHGLSYSTWTYSNLQVSGTLSATQGVNVSVTVTNNGPYVAHEVPQLYLGFPAAADEPPKLLRGFSKVKDVPVGSSQTVTFPLDATSVRIWGVIADNWSVVPGTYQVLVGSSSRDIRLTGSLTVTA